MCSPCSAVRRPPSLPRRPRSRRIGIAAGRSGSRAARLAARAAARPARVKLARLELKSGTATFGDEGVAPGREWKLEGVTVDGTGLSTSPDDPPGKLGVRAQVTARPGPGGPRPSPSTPTRFALTPLAASARVRVDGFALATIRPYWPESRPRGRARGRGRVGPRGRGRAGRRWPVDACLGVRQRAPRRAPGGPARPTRAVPPDPHAHRRAQAGGRSGADHRARRDRGRRGRSSGRPRGGRQYRPARHGPRGRARDRGGQGADGAHCRRPEAVAAPGARRRNGSSLWIASPSPRAPSRSRTGRPPRRRPSPWAT